jgi:hypothetical protein
MVLSIKITHNIHCYNWFQSFDTKLRRKTTIKLMEFVDICLWPSMSSEIWVSAFQRHTLCCSKRQSYSVTYLYDQALCREGIWGNGGKAPSFQPRYYMKLSGQFHAHNTHCIERCLASKPVWMLWRREKFFVPAGSRALVVQPVAYSLYRLSHPDSL